MILYKRVKYLDKLLDVSKLKYLSVLLKHVLYEPCYTVLQYIFNDYYKLKCLYLLSIIKNNAIIYFFFYFLTSYTFN